MKALYRTVIIKGEADLPEEDGEYWCHFRVGVKAMTLVKRINVKPDEFDWYLLPVDLPTDIEKENAAIEGMQREEGDIIKIIDSPYACAFIDGWEAYRDKLLNR